MLSLHITSNARIAVLDFYIPVLILTAVDNYYYHLDLYSTDNVCLLSLSPSSRTNVTNFVSLSLVIL